jgi:hypothetical protein
VLTAVAALCATLVWWVGYYVRGFHGWRSLPPAADSGAVSLREHMSLTGRPPLWLLRE